LDLLQSPIRSVSIATGQLMENFCEYCSFYPNATIYGCVCVCVYIFAISTITIQVIKKNINCIFCNAKCRNAHYFTCHAGIFFGFQGRRGKNNFLESIKDGRGPFANNVIYT
jgi:hypothetical protein